ncbi:MAG: conjugal transfer protein TraF [Desulfomonilaceae bacterium]
MNRARLFSTVRFAEIVILTVTILYWGSVDTAAAKGKMARNTVGIVFFAAHDCPHCETVEDLLSVLKSRYPLRVKEFDVEREADYKLLKRIEAIHSAEKLSVPVILVGESIIMGEDEITARLEKTVRALVNSGGSPFPYLGPTRIKHRDPKSVSAHCNRDGASGPPQVTDELSKLRKYIEELF